MKITTLFNQKEINLRKKITTLFKIQADLKQLISRNHRFSNLFNNSSNHQLKKEVDRDPKAKKEILLMGEVQNKKIEIAIT